MEILEKKEGEIEHLCVLVKEDKWKLSWFWTDHCDEYTSTFEFDTREEALAEYERKKQFNPFNFVKLEELN